MGVDPRPGRPLFLKSCCRCRRRAPKGAGCCAVRHLAETGTAVVLHEIRDNYDVSIANARVASRSTALDPRLPDHADGVELRVPLMLRGAPALFLPLYRPFTKPLDLDNSRWTHPATSALRYPLHRHPERSHSQRFIASGGVEGPRYRSISRCGSELFATILHFEAVRCWRAWWCGDPRGPSTPPVASARRTPLRMTEIARGYNELHLSHPSRNTRARWMRQCTRG